MTFNLPFVVAARDDVPLGDADNLVSSLLNLLDLAGVEIESDIETAKLSIRRASSILRIEMERRIQDATRDTCLGELAAWQVSRVRAYIDEHLTERIHVKDLSAVARRSTAHFCRAFKKTLGETPHSYITRRRLHQAQHLMLTSDAALSEIAVHCGFSDQAHFCNRFREATGQSPAAWRRERREHGTVVPYATSRKCITEAHEPVLATN